MRVIVINTGTELLLGDVLNSHLAFIAREISVLGLRIDRQVCVPDGEPIGEVLAECLEKEEILFVPGGLGPTTDDITREITASLLGLRLSQDQTVLAAISNRAATRGYKLTERTFRQADVPEGAIVLRNEHGSAPGLYLPASGTRPHLFLLPGPPRELHPMFVERVMPILHELVPSKPLVGRRTFHITGIGESLVEKAVGEKLLGIPGIELGYCTRPGEVDLRILGNSSVLDRAESIITKTLGSAVFSRDGRSLEETVVGILTTQRKTLAIVESCTGGFIAHRITNVPGASAVFLAGYVTYSNQAKVEVCGVDPELIVREGAVSENVAQALAEGARKRAGANLALATTGIAGPGGGTPAKPVGTVFVALASEGTPTKVRHFFFPDDRATFKALVSQAALEMVRQTLLGSQETGARK